LAAEEPAKAEILSEASSVPSVEEQRPPELGVETEHFTETPNIGRESFEAFAGKHVLVVEDNPVNRKLILTLMEGSGIELDSAEDGIEALEKLRAPGAAFDMVLMDVNMPKMDGLECTRQIRKDPALKEIPVLALTASTTPEEVEAILESGMNGYLDKPLNLGKLYTAFIRFLREYRVPGREEPTDPVSEVSTDRSVLDPAIGLEHTNEDRGLYRMLLEDFLQQYGDSSRRFQEMSEAKDYEGMRRFVIDLEGISGTLGAVQLYTLLRKVNHVLEKGTTMVLPDFIDEYAHDFERLEGEIRRYLKG
jgi:CheY-like chemotaxis protein